MALPLRSSIYFTAVFLMAILAGLLTLGIRQYQLLKNYETVISQSEKMIFHFSIIREEITDSLLEGRFSNLSGINKEFEDINTKLSQILANKHVPDEYKLSFINQEVDLPGIIIQFRGIDKERIDTNKLRMLNREVRVLGDRLMMFDRVIVNHAKRKLIGFQNIVIGALAIVLFILVNVLVVFHRQVAVPLLFLGRQVKEVAQGIRASISLGKKSGEVSELAESFSNLLISKDQSSEGLAKHNRTHLAVESVAYSIVHAKSKENLFQDICKSLLVNDDYYLAWIGLPDMEHKKIRPVAVNGTNTMSSRECEEYMDILLNSAEERGGIYNSAMQALLKGEPVIQSDVLSGVPKGLRKNIPFEGSNLSCASFPLIWNKVIYGVLCIYATSRDCFEDTEMDLLTVMTTELGLAIYNYDVLAQLRQKKVLNKQIVSAVKAVLISISSSGKILSLNSEAEKIIGRKEQEIVGGSFLDFFVPLGEDPQTYKDKGIEALNSYMLDDIREMVVPQKDGSQRILRCQLTNCLVQQDDEQEVLCIGQDVTEQKRAVEDLSRNLDAERGRKIETFRASHLAALGELTTGVAHVINNSSNGIINYAQVLEDEAKDSAWSQGQIELLEKIIKEGERVADIVQKLLSYGREMEGLKETVKIGDVVSDANMLVKEHFKNDGIITTLHSMEGLPPVTVNVAKMRQVFIHLLNNARRALNLKYKGKDDNKRLEIKGEMAAKNGKNLMRISLTDWGVGIDPGNMSKIFDPSFSTKPPDETAGMGLAISKDLVEDHGGFLHVESELGDHTTVAIELPVN
ncbi:MAG: PAS domain S-box protein [Proteobacteria bacterium]|nr:PAS domain S-box protein [Pseudomonadota bacterium]